MKYNNEAIELIETVLSESERWQYRIGDVLSNKKAKLKKEIENEKRKIEDYGKKDTSKLEELQDKYDHTAVPSRMLRIARKGIKGTEDDLFYRAKAKKTLDRAAAPANSMPYNDTPAFEYSKDRGMYYNTKVPENKALHDRINRRTQKYDTTAKHEACMILIEALNTLLNE